MGLITWRIELLIYSIITSSTIAISTLITAYSGYYIVKKFKLGGDNM